MRIAVQPVTSVRFYVNGIAFSGPDLDSWETLSHVLKDDAPWVPATDWDPAPASMSPRAARRVTPQIRLALSVAEQLGDSVGDDAGWIFASSVGEGETLHVILEALRSENMMIQPLRFQNAVHNAAAGQWSIAAGITGPMTSIAALDQTAGAGFLKAMLQTACENRSVGLVLYDVPLPEPLDAKRPLGVPLGAGFCLSPHTGPHTLAAIDIALCDAEATKPERSASQALQATGNPVSDVLPLLEILSAGTSGRVIMGLHGGSALCLDVKPA